MFTAATRPTGTATRLVTGRVNVRPVRTNPVPVVRSTRWILEPEPKWCSLNADKCEKLIESIDLSDCLCANKEQGARIGSAEDDDCDYNFECGRTGVKVRFVSEGKSNPTDSPSSLSLEHLDAEDNVKVDGKSLKAGEKVVLRPGTKLELGDVMYQVLRNVQAHA